jgi:hypothetical protein
MAIPASRCATPVAIAQNRGPGGSHWGAILAVTSGKTLREPGAFYQCHHLGGKHSCIERDLEMIPLKKIGTVLPEDTFGISKILSDYRVETTFQTLGPRSTQVEISHYYSTTTLKAKLLNLIAKGKIARETQATLNAARATIEAACRAG